MQTKKSKKADIERNRAGFFQIGLISALSLSLIAFEWSSEPAEKPDELNSGQIIFEPEQIQIALREKPQPVPPTLRSINKIVPDDVAFIEEVINFDAGATVNTKVFFSDIPEIPEIVPEEKTFVKVEDMPEFNGGDPQIEFRKFISRELKYPEIAAANGAGGKVYVQFVVNTKGKVVDAVVLNPVDVALDAEALRVINSSPLWTPGKQRGKPVKVLFTFPIKFVLK